MKSYPLVVVLILAGTLAGCHGKAKLYSATAEMQVKPQGIPDVPAFGSNFVSSPQDLTQPFQSEIELIKSPDVLLPLIMKQGLDRIWAQRFGTGQAVMSPLEAIQHLQKNLVIERVGQTNIIKVTAQSELPQEAADIANGIVDQYKAIRDNEESQRYRGGEDALRLQITKQQSTVDQLKDQLEKLKQGGSLPPSGFTLPQAEAELKEQQDLLDALTIRLKQLEAFFPLRIFPVRIVSRAVLPPA